MSAERKRVLDDLSRLIAIASINPPGGELEPARWVARRVQESGIPARVDNLGDNRGNVVATLDIGPGPTLVFCTHLDVVPADYPGAWGARIEDDRLYGRGSCDAKGPLVAMLAAMERIGRDPAGARGRLVLAAVADEEGEALGARALVAGGFRADAAVIGEPTDNRVVLASRGVARFAVDVRGDAAHSSDPSRGRNAIYGAARIALEIEALQEQLVKSGIGGSASATLMGGGTKVNVIPDRATVTIDRRLAPTESTASAVVDVEAILERLREAEPRFEASWRAGGIWVEPFVVAESVPLAREAIIAANGRRGDLFPGITDAPHLIEAGIPTVIVGPGDMAQAHSAEEYISLEALMRGIDIYERIARRMLTGGLATAEEGSVRSG